MAKNRNTPEEIVGKLRQVEVLVGQGKPVAEAIRAIGVTEPTYCRWRAEYGGLKLLEQENGRLRRTVSGLTLEKLILKGETAERVNASGTSRRRSSSYCRGPRHGGAGRLAALCLQGAGPAPLHAAKARRTADDEAALTQAIIDLPTQYGRYGHRRITALLHPEG